VSKRRAVPTVETQRMKLGELLPAEYNPRKISDRAMKGLRASLERFGELGGIVWNRRTGRLVGGHQRVKALAALGVADAEVRVVDIDATEEKAANLALNHPGIGGEWDEALLSAVLADVQRELPTAFEELQLGDLWAEAEDVALDGATDEDDAPEPPERAVSQRGDLWVMGEHRVLCGDAADPRDAARLMDGRPHQLTVVDPPYEMPDSVWARWVADPSIVFGQMRQMRMIPAAWWRFERVVVKRYRHRSATVQIDHRHAFIAQVGTDRVLPGTSETFPSVIEQEADLQHDHQKPVALLVEHMTAWSPQWTVVLDPFLGSGSTLIAAESIGRACIGIEIDPACVDAIVLRWQAQTGCTATLDGDGRTWAQVQEARHGAAD
jgi:hypothetical protein